MVIRAAPGLPFSVESPCHVKRASESRRFRSDELIQNLRNSRRFMRRKIRPPLFLRSLRPFASSAVKIFVFCLRLRRAAGTPGKSGVSQNIFAACFQNQLPDTLLVKGRPHLPDDRMGLQRAPAVKISHCDLYNTGSSLLFSDVAPAFVDHPESGEIGGWKRFLVQAHNIAGIALRLRLGHEPVFPEAS